LSRPTTLHPASGTTRNGVVDDSRKPQDRAQRDVGRPERRASAQRFGGTYERGDAYDARWKSLAESGVDVHGEANLVEALMREHGGRRVLDAGCGTGRVAIELARRGYATVGIDLDPVLLDRARAKAPRLQWREGDLAVLPAEVAPGPFAAVVLAGNVMIFLARGTEAQVVANLAARLQPGGLFVAGFQLNGRLALADYDAATSSAGLEPVARWSTWDRAPFSSSSDYVVAVDSKR
jgi:SAM-dependent methyltransferase